jgi:hypothetical protein
LDQLLRSFCLLYALALQVHASNLGSRGRSESCFQIAPMIASKRTTKSAA